VLLLAQDMFLHVLETMIQPEQAPMIPRDRRELAYDLPQVSIEMSIVFRLKDDCSSVVKPTFMRLVNVKKHAEKR
jgi:hypothetical protein